MAWHHSRPVHALAWVLSLVFGFCTVPALAQESSSSVAQDSEPKTTEVPPTLPAVPCTSEPGFGPEMILIEAGRFTMGSPDNEPDRNSDEGPQREIVIVRPFAIARCETTVGEFKLFVEDTGYVTQAESSSGCYALNDAGTNWEQRKDRHWRDPGFPQTDTHPVVCVSWNDALAYAEWLSRRTGQPYRLPSEAEWEYAARAGSRHSRFWGDDPNAGCAYANAADQALKRRYPDWPYSSVTCDDRTVYTAPAGSFGRNAFGLSDMLGNAWEWVRDCYADKLASVPADGTPWESSEGKTCARRVLRGGGWNNFPVDVRSASRISNAPVVASDFAGCRLARDL